MQPLCCDRVAMARPARKSVGSREIKTRFGTYLAMVKGGATLTVTERGRPVALLTPVTPADTEDDEAALQRMADEGLITRPTRSWRGLAWTEPLNLPGKPLSEIIIEDREDRL
jgi:prevent-host-death family protein